MDGIRPRGLGQRLVVSANQDDAAVRDAITSEILEAQKDAYGTGATSARTLLDQDLIIVLIDVELARSEQTLMDAGRGDAVKAVREHFQAAIAPTFRAIVERATGRRVTSFLSVMSVDPVYQVELFRLAL